MLPIDAPRANTLPILRFAGHGLIVAALSTHIVFIAYKAAALSPPPARRRSQRPVRNRNAIVLLLLAFLSLTSVSVFAFRWRILSYTQWASRHGHRIPNTLWSGWSGTANDAVGHWWLGDWLADVDLRREADNISILTPEGFLYTTQHLIGQLSTSIFIGVEAHKRNLSKALVSSLILLGSIGSLAFAQTLFFVIILYIPPIGRHADSPLHDLRSTPHHEAYYYPLASFALTPSFLPQAFRNGNNLSLLRSVYLLAPLYFAFLPKLMPASMRVQHSSIRDAYRSYAAVYRQLSIVSGILYTRAIFCSVYFSTPSDPSYIRDIFSNTISFPFNTKSIRFFSGASTAHLNIAPLSKHPVISATSIDVMFTAISLLAWILIYDLDVETLLENCFLYHVVSKHGDQIVSDDPGVQETIQQGHNVPIDPNARRSLGSAQNINAIPSGFGSSSGTNSGPGSGSGSATVRTMLPPPLPPRLPRHPHQPTASAIVTQSAAATDNAIPTIKSAIGAAVNVTTVATNAANAPTARTSVPAPAPMPAPVPVPAAASAPPAGAAAGVRRSARVRDYRAQQGLSRSVDSDADSYEDSTAQSNSDRSARNDMGDLTNVRAGESMAFALFMMFSGGLGALGAAVLGAETMA